jgi:single-stranded-DNA-specific exonuclease
MDDYLWDVTPRDDAKIQGLMDAAGVTRPTAVVLAERAIGPDEVRDFLQPALRKLCDPYLLPGAREAARHLWDAIRARKRILIHGDYDTDGITAAALMSWVLRSNGAEVECYLPHRIDDGYGLTSESIEKAMAENWDVLLTVDCGITSFAAVEMARQLGIELIITDHHTPGAELVDAAAVVDPKLPGTPVAMQDLAGVGVAFKVCHAFIKYGREHGYGGLETDLRDGLDLVALGTVADIVPLLHENRIMVKYGLGVLGRQHRPGLHALCEISKVNENLGAADITYRLAPRLNATGRMGDPTDSLRLLQCDSVVAAIELARKLDDQNRERQQIEENVVSRAEQQITEIYDLAANRSLVVWGDDWHQGVVGIVASRLTRRYHRPSVVLTRDQNGQFTGSARSVRHLNLVDLLEECSDCLTRFGGHAMAAGLSLDGDNIETFRRGFEEAVSRILGGEAMQPKLDICGEVGFAELSNDFFRELEQLEPFGHSNPEPIFFTRDVYPERRGHAGRSHTRGVLRDASKSKIGFIAFGRTPDSFPEPPWDLAYTPHINRYAGQEIPQVRILDVRPAES